MTSNDYVLLDSGKGQKLERFGPYTLVRPSAGAVWAPLCEDKWKEADATFSREGKEGWTFKKKIPPSWEMEIAGLKFKLSLTDFGHVGIFPEHRVFWEYLLSHISKGMNLLNLFAYSGAATLFAAKAGASVCHLDASFPTVEWARENARLNHLQESPIRWIVDDVFKFLKREIKRGVKYDAIVLDPPSFGRGKKQEVFKIERDVLELLDLCKALLSKKPSFVIFSSHTPGFTPIVMQNLLRQRFLEGKVSGGELVIDSKTTYQLPSGSYAIYENS